MKIDIIYVLDRKIAPFLVGALLMNKVKLIAVSNKETKQWHIGVEQNALSDATWTGFLAGTRGKVSFCIMPTFPTSYDKLEYESK